MATAQAQRYMPIRGPRFTQAVSVAQAGQIGGTLGELAWGAAAIFEALEAKSDRQKAQEAFEHEQAGDLASVRAKNHYRDWLTQIQARDDYHQISAGDLLEMQNRKISELVAGMSRFEEQAAQVDLDLSVIASRPVAVKQEREHKDRQAGIFADLKRAEDRALKGWTEYAKAFAHGGPEESEALFQEWQTVANDARTARKLAQGRGGWTAAAKEEIDTELDEAYAGLMRDAFREKAVLDGTVGELYGHVANRTDTLAPGGERLFAGVPPEEVAAMRALDSRRAATRMARLAAEDKAERERIEADHKEAYRRAELTAANADSPLETSFAIAEHLRKQGNPYADKIEADALKRNERQDDFRNVSLSDDREAQTQVQGLSNLVLLADEDELLDVEDELIRSGPEGRFSLNADQVKYVSRLIEVRRNRLEQMDEGEKEASRKWSREIKPILTKYHTFLADTQPVFEKGWVADIGIRATTLAARLEENYLQGDQSPQDRAVHAGILEFMLYGQYGDTPYVSGEGMEKSMERLDGLLYTLYDSGEAPKTEMELARVALPADVFASVKLTADGTQIAGMDEQVEHLTRVYRDEERARHVATQLISWRNLHRVLEAGVRPGLFRGERAQAMKMLSRYSPEAPASLASDETLDAVRNQ